MNYANHCAIETHQQCSWSSAMSSVISTHGHTHTRALKEKTEINKSTIIFYSGEHHFPKQEMRGRKTQWKKGSIWAPKWQIQKINGLVIERRVKNVIFLLENCNRQPVDHSINETTRDWAEHQRKKNLLEMEIKFFFEGCSNTRWAFKTVFSKKVAIEKIKYSLAVWHSECFTMKWVAHYRFLHQRHERCNI